MMGYLMNGKPRSFSLTMCFIWACRNVSIIGHRGLGLFNYWLHAYNKMPATFLALLFFSTFFFSGHNLKKTGARFNWVIAFIASPEHLAGFKKTWPVAILVTLAVMQRTEAMRCRLNLFKWRTNDARWAYLPGWAPWIPPGRCRPSYTPAALPPVRCHGPLYNRSEIDGENTFQCKSSCT